MLTDTHAHLDFFENPDKIIEEAFSKDVKRMIIPGVEPTAFDKIREISNKYQGIYSAYGIHPSESMTFTDEVANKIISLLKEDEKAIAIGEIGLDYHYEKESLDKELQKEVFKKQLEIAKIFDKPVLIHARDAFLDTFNILKEYEMKKVIMHCFSGSLESAKECIKQGWLIAFGGVVTFKNAKKLKEVALEIPLDKIVLETDCPYLAPHPFRGEENSPKYIPLIAKEIANIKDITYDEVVEATENNVKRFFNLGE